MCQYEPKKMYDDMNLRNYISNNADLTLIRIVQNDSLLQVALPFLSYYNPIVSSAGLIQQFRVSKVRLLHFVAPLFLGSYLICKAQNGLPPCL